MLLYFYVYLRRISCIYLGLAQNILTYLLTYLRGPMVGSSDRGSNPGRCGKIS